MLVVSFRFQKSTNAKPETVSSNFSIPTDIDSFDKMKFNFKSFIICIGLSFLLNSCTTYIIPLDSFKQQFSKIDSTKLKRVTVKGPIGELHVYSANPIKTISCIDKKGNPIQLVNKPSIEIRFTYGQKNTKSIFYFDRIFVNDSLVIGVQSRFISTISKTIPLKDITKIEVQDGKKNFNYVEQ